VRLYGFQVYTQMEKEERGSAGFHNTGTLVVCTDEKVEKYTKTGIALAKAAGYEGEYLTDPDEIRRHFPDINMEGVLGAGWTSADGYFDPTMAASTFVRKIKANGGQVCQYTNVEKINMQGNRVSVSRRIKAISSSIILWMLLGPGRATPAAWWGLNCPSGTPKPSIFPGAPNKKLDYPFPTLKYPRFYARPEGDNIFICKAHLTMDLNDPMHAGIWDPDALMPTGGRMNTSWNS